MEDELAAPDLGDCMGRAEEISPGRVAGSGSGEICGSGKAGGVSVLFCAVLQHICSLGAEGGAYPMLSLKGIALNELYPSADMRKLADVDIYIPDAEAFRRAEVLLRARGFAPEEGGASFHTGYRKDMGGKSYLLELHWRPCDFLPDSAADQVVMDIFSKLPVSPKSAGLRGRIFRSCRLRRMLFRWCCT